MDESGFALIEEPAFRTDTCRNGSNSATVRLIGELDIASTGAAWRAVEQLDAGIRQIVLDLSDLTYCDAAGVGFLLAAQRKARTTGRELIVRHPSRPVRRVLAITGDLDAICPADPPADEEPEPAGLRHPATASELVTHRKRIAGAQPPASPNARRNRFAV